MNTIGILKQIVDLLYEESKSNDINTLKIKLKSFEREINEKNTEIAQLCTENIKLENMLRKYEADFETLSKMTGYTQEENKSEAEPEIQTEINIESEKNEEINEPQTQPVDPKKHRKDYMKEYQRNYRKKKREEKQMSMNV